MSGQQVAGQATDCIRFVTGVLDTLYGWRRELPKNHPLDTALHSPEEAWAALRNLLRLYPEAEQVPPRMDGVWEVQPGDIVVTGPSQGGPGHAILVGPDKNTCWEAADPHVCKIGIGLSYRTQRVYKVYRMNNREEWIDG